MVSVRKFCLFLPGWLGMAMLLAPLGFLLAAGAATAGLIVAGHAWGSPIAIFVDQVTGPNRVRLGLGPFLHDLPSFGFVLGIALSGLLVARWAYGLPWSGWVRATSPPRWRLTLIALVLGGAVFAGAGLTEGALSADGFNPDLGWLRKGAVRAAVVVLGWSIVNLLWAAAEEVVFRGLIQRHLEFLRAGKWLAALAASILFWLAHRDFTVPGFLSYLAMGLGFSWAAIRTGGLEFGIGLHAAYNIVADLMGDQAPDGSPGGADWWAGNIQAVASALATAVLIVVLTEGLRHSTAAAAPAPSAPATPPAAPP